MKILFSTCSYSWGGLEIIGTRIVKGLIDKGTDIKFLCYKGSKIEENCKKNNIPTIDIPDNQLNAIRKLTKYLITNYDIIHTNITHDLWSIVPAMILSKSSAKLFLKINMESGINKKDIFHRFIYKKVDKVFTVSEFIKDNVLKQYPFDPAIVHVLHDGVDINIFSNENYDKEKIKDELNIKDNEIIIGHCGRISYGKGHTELAKAAELIDKNTNYNIKYLIVGDAAPDEKDCKKDFIDELDRNGMKDKFIFAGFQNDVAKYMSVMDILAFPSHKESFGDTIVEAMSMELPVIACRSGGAKEIVAENETGFLVEPKNHEQLADALTKLINDRELRIKFGKAGRARVIEKFNIEEKINTLLHYYENEKQNQRRTINVQNERKIS